MLVQRDFPKSIAMKLELLPMQTIKNMLENGISDDLSVENKYTVDEDTLFDMEIAEAITYSLQNDKEEEMRGWEEFSKEIGQASNYSA